MVIYVRMEAERAANQSVWDINIRVGAEGVCSPYRECTEISRGKEARSEVSNGQIKK